jgi:hypothetical protein
LSRPASGAGHKKDWHNFAAKRRRRRREAPPLPSNFQNILLGCLSWTKSELILRKILTLISDCQPAAGGLANLAFGETHPMRRRHSA